MESIISIFDNLLPFNLSSSLGTIGLIFILGFIIGLGYFGGLWLTLNKLPQNHHPYRLMIGSFILRLVITLCCFYGLTYLFDNLDTGIILLIAVLGFIVARFILIQQMALPKSTK